VRAPPPGDAPLPEKEPDPEEDEEPVDLASLSPDEFRAYERRYEQRIYSRLDKRFTGQQPDRAWRGDAEDRLTNAFRSIGSKSVAVESVECRSDMCLTRLAHDSPRLESEFINQFINQFVRGFEHVFRYDDGITTIYSLRHDDVAPADP
jgi:hypothetical protein